MVALLITEKGFVLLVEMGSFVFWRKRVRLFEKESGYLIKEPGYLKKSPVICRKTQGVK